MVVDLRAPGLLDSVRGGPAKESQGQDGRRVDGGERLLKTRELTGVADSAKIPRCRGLGRGRRARGVSWGSGGASARLRWGLGVAERRAHGGAGALRGGARCGAAK